MIAAIRPAVFGVTFTVSFVVVMALFARQGHHSETGSVHNPFRGCIHDDETVGVAKYPVDGSRKLRRFR